MKKISVYLGVLLLMFCLNACTCSKEAKDEVCSKDECNVVCDEEKIEIETEVVSE